MPLTVDELINKLKQFDLEKEIYYEFGGFQPCKKPFSWRGDYSELSLGYESGYEDKDVNPIFVGELIDVLQDVKGRTLEGFKGGLFLMNGDTPVWADDYGRYTGTAIVDVKYDFFVYLVTANESD